VGALAARKLLEKREEGKQVGGGQQQGQGHSGQRPDSPATGTPPTNHRPTANATHHASGGRDQQDAQEAGKPRRLERPDPSRPPKRPNHDHDGRDAPGGRRPRLFAALLSASDAAALDIQTVAFDAAGAAYNVSVYMPAAKEQEEVDSGATANVTRLVLGFPYFNSSLHYDPTLSVEPATDLGYTATTDTTAVAARGAAWSAHAGAARAAATALAAAALFMLTV
jgi:hypothetical protein